MAKVALTLIKGLGLLGRGLAALGRWLKPTGLAVGRVFSRFLFFPIYKLATRLRIRLGKVLASAHGFLFLLFTNRYVFHALLLVISLVTLTSQLQPRTASALDVGRHSLLYAMVTNDQDAVIDEPVQANQLAKNSNYLGGDTLQALPGIDYDYEPLIEDTLPADLAVPGAIAVQPGGDQTGDTGTMVIPLRARTEIYLVQDGDSLAVIAQKFGVTVGTVMWANNFSNNTIIRPGDKLKIPAMSGVLHLVRRGDTVESIAQRYKAKTDDIYAANRLSSDSLLAVGDELVVPGGIPPAPVPVKPTARPVAVRPDVPLSNVSGKALDKYQELQNSLDLRTKPPDQQNISLPEHKLLWPTRLHVINQYYSWRHTGVDFDGDYTDPIYAADDGVVEKAGWNSGGYGLMILIDHQDGYKTRYGHASKIFVNAGDTVKRGQVIAMIGTTGRSTGTHLHFEVYINGRRVNPLSYIR